MLASISMLSCYLSSGIKSTDTGHMLSYAQETWLKVDSDSDLSS